MQKRNKGFTLIEMIVTLIVLSIVLTLSVSGLLAWQDWSNFNRENEYAQSLFMAAQNQLTEYGADGRLKELQDSLSGKAVDDKTGKKYSKAGLNLTDSVSYLKNADGDAYSLTGIFPASKGKKNEKLYQDEIVSLRAQTGDYNRYLEDPVAFKTQNPEAYWVFELLGAYVYDTSILSGSKSQDGSGNGAAICVEFAPESGQVFSVLYSDFQDGFLYENLPGEKKQAEEGASYADICDRSESVRKEHMIGYYGVDTLSKATTNKLVTPALSSVKLYNRETFYLTCRLSADYRTLLTSQLTYLLDLNPTKNVNDKLLTIELPGNQLKNEENAQVISCPVSRYDADGNAVSIGEFPVLAWVEPDYTIHVVLDAADIQATTDLYDRELTSIRSADKCAATKFAKTMSFFRFGVKAEDCYASVHTKGEGFSDSKTVSNFGNLNLLKNQEAKHPVFAGAKTETENGKQAYTYSLNNGRHLYNVRYLEDLSYEKEAGSQEEALSVSGETFVLKSDIDWNEFITAGNLYNSEASNLLLSGLNGKIMDEDGNLIENVSRYNCDFPSISQLREKDCFDGNHKTISGIRISEISNVLYGLYSQSSNGGQTIRDPHNRPVGFININYGTIRNLKLDNITAAGSENIGGFAGVNAGQVSSLELLNTGKKSLVMGQKHVGGIVGAQLSAEETTTMDHLVNRAKVEGVEAVGGIVGMLRNEYASLTLDFDGLSGLSAEKRKALLQPENHFIRVTDCENYGEIAGRSSAELHGIYTGTSKTAASPEEPRYIGGIAGYSYNQTDDTEKIMISDCISSPQFETTELASILSDDASLERHLKGVYVGGIVGYNYYGQINRCKTTAARNMEGCLFGYRYVGGIVGFNIGPASGIVGTSAASSQGENTNHVVAYEYAGGITGCNAGVQDVDSEGNSIAGKQAKDPEKLEGLLLPASGRNLNVKIDNWVNKGIVIAVSEYAGGITGYNSGYIYRCNSNVKASVANACFEKLYSGNYAGGIAGYNNGVIGNTQRRITENGKSSQIESAGKRFSVVCYVKGHNYVGGIVGYNDVDSVVEDYEVASGYVLGDEGSCFVGGYAGLNASVDLLMHQDQKTDGSYTANTARFIHSNPNRVKGSYFVGGNIGGNLLNMEDAARVSEINGVFLTDNFLGILEGKAFVGGFIGYNLLFEDEPAAMWIAEDEDSSRGGVYIVQKKLIQEFDASDASAKTSEEKLSDKKEIIDHINEKLNIRLTPSAKRVLLSGQDAGNTKVSFGSISGEIYVGGVLGYNDENTSLYIKNVENATPIESTAAIVCGEEQSYVDAATGAVTERKTDYAGEAKEFYYSYAGGIIGKVGKNTVLDNCWNAPTGTVTTKGTYTGGLCEINEGTIQNCKLSNFGSSVQDYVGGLCGLNKADITTCYFENKTVSGRNVVGGIAAENFGRIRNISLSGAKLNAEGEVTENGEKHGVAGIIAAYNGTQGVITLEKDIADITVTSAGRYAGIVAGINEGSVVNAKTITKNAVNGNLVISGSVKGQRTVGALFGLNKNPDKNSVVEYYTNRASVTAVDGNAGGIIGENESGNNIRYCVNDGIVSAPDSGNAGGITSSNNSQITDCIGYQSVNAPEGMCGGITAVNLKNGKISSCQVKPADGQANLVFRSNKTVGGIAAENYGLVTGNYISEITITNETTSRDTNMGTLVGDNKESGQILFADSRSKQEGTRNCKIIVRSNYAKAGGVAGINAGSITGTADAADGRPASVVNSVIFMENATVASIGGIAGSNTGSILNMAADARIEGELGASGTGYGGIAGISGWTGKKDVPVDADGREMQAEIVNCSFDGYLNAEGSSGAPVRVGGITGINAYGGLIEDCIIGARAEDADGNQSSEAAVTYVTAGDITKTADSVNTTDTKSYSNLGGIAGDNYGKILACDNRKNSSDEVRIIGFAGETGGIVGFNYAYGRVSGYYEDKKKQEHYLTTGKNWTIEQRCSSNDRGPGGIIGKSVSAEPFSYVINYAPVICDYKSNNYAGGMIGILAQQYALKVEFKNCENYGDIRAYRNAGGFVGMLESKGADFYDCKNWGDITGTSYTASGFVAMQYSFSVPINFTSCANHGNIKVEKKDGNARVAGFVAWQQTMLGGIRLECDLYDCVNTGTITYADGNERNNRIGIFFGTAYSNVTVILDTCRNYNNQNGVNGLAGSGSNIGPKNCFDNSGIVTTNNENTPFGGQINWNANLLYLDQDSATRFTHKDYGVYFSYYPGTNGDYTYNGSNYNTLKDSSYIFAEPSTANQFSFTRREGNINYKQLEFNLTYREDSDGMDGMVVYFWNNSINRSSAAGISYTCEATYYYEDGSTQTTQTQSATGTYALSEQGRAVLRNPSSDKKPQRVSVRLMASNGQAVYLRGICYIPGAEEEEAVCTYLGKKTGATFDISSVEQMRADNTKINNLQINSSHVVARGIKYCQLNDVLAIDWADYESLRLPVSNGNSADVTFTLDGEETATGMDAFVFYLANNNTNSQTSAQSVRTYYYDYSVSFTDKNNHTVTTDVVRDAIGYDSAEIDYKERSRQEVKVPAGLDRAITKITLHIKNTKFTTVNNGSVQENTRNSGDIYFRGFGWIPEGESEQKMAAGVPADTRVSLYDKKDNNRRFLHLAVDYSGDTPYVYEPANYEHGFYMSYAGNNPISSTYYSDHRSYRDSVTEGQNSGSRIDTYLDLDPKIMKLMQTQCIVNWKLDAPKKLSKTEDRGYLKFAWEPVLNAYQHEVYYQLVDKNGEVVYTSEIETIGGFRDNYFLPIDNSWGKNGYQVKFYVRAINAYHLAHMDEQSKDYDPDYEKYDSDWVTPGDGTDEEKLVLPVPEVHLEVVAGNRTTFILDNYDAYEEIGGTDCTIRVKYNNTQYQWNLAEGKVYRMPETINGSDRSAVEFSCQAVPNASIQNTFAASAFHYQRGEGLGNNHLPSRDKYCNTDFRGFYGTEADDMEYQVAFRLDSQDSYLMTDISAYDDAIGATVVYDYEITHAANNNNGGGSLTLTSTLKNLPEEWFSGEKISKVTVRAYPYHSQFDIIHYGHTVAEGITLDGTAEENQAVLASIYDEKYFAADASDMQENAVWDDAQKDLKSGYLLQKQDDGSYNIYYSALIEMAQTQAADRRLTMGESYREYYKYAVYYRIYSDFSAETKDEKAVNSVDYMESYWSRGISDGLTSNYNANWTTSNNRKDVQEIQSAPIVEDQITKTFDENGDITYHFAWDTYYLDTACQKPNQQQLYTDANLRYLTDAKGVFATWDSYLQKFEKAGLSMKPLASDGTTRSRYKDLMNMYYNAYSTGSYRVDLIGTTADGKEFILDSTTVNAPTEKGILSSRTDENGEETGFYTMDGKTSTTYRIWDYECSFTDTRNIWSSYPKLTARVMRLGSTTSIKKTNGQVDKDVNQATFILPRYAEKSIEIKLKMNTISKPEVTLLKENGQFITNDLVYDVQWGGITDQKQKKDLGGYLITAMTQSGTVKHIHYYYVTDLTDAADTQDEIGLNRALLEAEGELTDVTADYVTDGAVCRTRINLADFNTDDLVEISVQAIARLNAESYTDSDSGVTNEIVIPERLSVPDVAKLSCKLPADLTDETVTHLPMIVDMETYKAGFAFLYNAEDYADIPDAEIVMAAAVYDSRPDSADTDRSLVTDAFDEGAEKVLYTRENPDSFGRTADNNVITLPISDFERYPGEYAGKWMKIALQAVCETKIDSQWSDLDPAEKTVNYAWIQIPALQLPNITLTDMGASENEDIVRYGLEGKVYNTSRDEMYETPLASRSLRFEEEKNADGYAITMKVKAETTEAASDQPQPVMENAAENRKKEAEAEEYSVREEMAAEVAAEKSDIEEMAVEDAAVEDTLMEDAAVEDTLVEEEAMEDTLVEEAATEDAVIEDAVQPEEEAKPSADADNEAGNNAAGSAGNETEEEITYILYLQRHLTDASDEKTYDGSWDVYLAADDAAHLPAQPDGKPSCTQNADAVWIGRTGMLLNDEEVDGSTERTDIVEIPSISREFVVDAESYQLTAQLRYNRVDGNGSFILVLPDLTKVGETPYDATDYFTESVEVRHYVREERPYVAGEPAYYKKEEQE